MCLYFENLQEVNLQLEKEYINKTKSNRRNKSWGFFCTQVNKLTLHKVDNPDVELDTLIEKSCYLLKHV